jgi:hypothetical protein
VITTVPKSKAHLKPSQQTQFVLDVMAEMSSSAEQRWERVQESVDQLFAKMEAQEEAQHRMAVQVDLTAQAIAR